VLNRLQLDRWLFGSGPGQRRTQDSPILPEVWYAFALTPSALDGDASESPLVAPEQPSDPGEPGAAGPSIAATADLLLRPRVGASAAELAHVLGRRLLRPRSETKLAYNDAYVACEVTFEELLRVLLPLTEYWQIRLWPGHPGSLQRLLEEHRERVAAALEPGHARLQGRRSTRDGDVPGDVIWLIGLVGRIAWERRQTDAEQEQLPTAREVVDAALEAFGSTALGRHAQAPVLWSVARNRPVQTTVYRSRIACKVDAATRVFGISCGEVSWAVIDSGIDARHPAFARRIANGSALGDGLDASHSGQSRITATWDFADIRGVLSGLSLGPRSRAGIDADEDDDAAPLTLEDPLEVTATRVHDWVVSGRAVEWDEIAPLLAVSHDRDYRPPEEDHGTHVAGILAGDWRADDATSAGEHAIQGMCPDLRLYDLRAFDASGRSDEFQILSAMQFIRHLNSHADELVIHGVNMSFSVRHEVDKYAAGATPVCEEAHRLIGSGVVVVAAAGNDGWGGYMVRGRNVDGYRSVSITDPGNAEKVITVGATHRDRPHTYGVSYFSSRGPTGDGRIKPDLVAPGEKITSVVPEAGLQSKDGTSQATPHVSGACALLIARHPELIGQPERIKQILIDSCTDLGRERSFQGAGMIDVLRALQSV
jgi:serine protease AprX